MYMVDNVWYNGTMPTTPDTKYRTVTIEEIGAYWADGLHHKSVALARHAAETGEVIELDFNGDSLRAEPGWSWEQVCDDWSARRSARQAAVASSVLRMRIRRERQDAYTLALRWVMAHPELTAEGGNYEGGLTRRDHEIAQLAIQAALDPDALRESM